MAIAHQGLLRPSPDPIRLGPGAQYLPHHDVVELLRGGAGLVALTVLQPSGRETFVLSPWLRLEAANWGLAFWPGGLLAIIATAVAAADRLTPASAVGFFDTTYLGFAASWRALFFGEILTAREGFWIAMIAAGAFPLSAEWQNREEH